MDKTPLRFLLPAALAAFLSLPVEIAFAPSAAAQRFDAPPGACGFYINSSGHAVPRPCGDWHSQPTPPRATARCADGTYSYSEHPSASGTCSHHGGAISYVQ
jgi:Protein of unknown function (DUF3761)